MLLTILALCEFPLFPPLVLLFPMELAVLDLLGLVVVDSLRKRERELVVRIDSLEIVEVEFVVCRCVRVSKGLKTVFVGRMVGLHSVVAGREAGTEGMDSTMC